MAAVNKLIQSLMENRILSQKKILILGSSFTGKSTLVISLLSEKQKEKDCKIFIFNDKDRQYEKSPILNNLSYQNLDNFDIETMEKNSVCVIEDVISLNKIEVLNLRTLANWACHHRNVCLYVISHTVKNTNLSCLANQFDQIIFTGDLRNMNVAKYLFPNFGIVEPKRTSVFQEWSKFHTKHNQYYYIIINCKTGQVYGASNKEGLLKNELKCFTEEIHKKNLSSSSILQKFIEMEGGFNRPKKARTLFTLISKHLKNINSNDLTFILNTNGIKMTISILDYIHTILDPNIKPSLNQIQFHNYILKNKIIPDFLIINPRLNKNLKTILD